MATEQDTKELSMAEILSSIRQILEENGAGEKIPQKEETDDEVLELNSSMIVDENEEQQASPVVPAFVAKENVVQPQTKQNLFAQELDIREEDSNFCASPYEMMQNVKTKTQEQSDIQADMPTKAIEEEKLSEPEALSDVSKEIVNSFTKMFEENNFGYHKNTPSFDAETLLKQLISQAVEERLDNRILLSMVKETIVPVLEAWLSHYLPKMVAEEVRRVMAKAGKR